MAVLESLATALATKAGAALAGTAIAVGGVGAAGAAGALPEHVQERFDGVVGTERGAPESVEVVEVEQKLAEEKGAEADAAGDNGKGADVSDAAKGAEAEEGEPRGHAVSEAVRGANGSLEKSQGKGFERRAEAQQRAAERRAAGEAGADEADDRRPEAPNERAAAGRANGDAEADDDAIENEADALGSDVDADEDEDEFDAGPPADAGAERGNGSERRATPDVES